MNRSKGKYLPKFKMKKLNASTPATDKFAYTKNSMKNKSFGKKQFRSKATLRRAGKGIKGRYPSAVKSATSGRPGAARSFAYPTPKMHRVDQISPAQRGAMRPPTTTVAVTPRKQNKKPVSNGPKGIAAYRKSIRKSMGYNS